MVEILPTESDLAGYRPRLHTSYICDAENPSTSCLDNTIRANVVSSLQHNQLLNAFKMRKEVGYRGRHDGFVRVDFV
jgi:hypothetical protein